MWRDVLQRDKEDGGCCTGRQQNPAGHTPCAHTRRRAERNYSRGHRHGSIFIRRYISSSGNNKKEKKKVFLLPTRCHLCLPDGDTGGGHADLGSLIPKLHTSNTRFSEVGRADVPRGQKRRRERERKERERKEREIDR